MDTLIMMLGMLVGLIIAYIFIAYAQRSSPQPAKTPYNTPQSPSTLQRPPSTETVYRPNDSVSEILRETTEAIRRITHEATIRRQISQPPSYPPLYPQTRNTPLNSSQILETWRKSVLGLIKLAESNLQTAKFYIKTMNYYGAVDAAAASVENISRALLHCYGEKPNPNSDQEEPLKMVAGRLQGEERARFEKAINEAMQVHRNKIFGKCILENGIQISPLDEAKTRQTVEGAKEIVIQFRRIIEEHFETEIAELSEKCPKCGALSISLWAFSIQGATYQCNICSHKWTQPCNT